MSADREITPDELAGLHRCLADGICELLRGGMQFPMTLTVTDARGARLRLLMKSPGETEIVESTTAGALVAPFEMVFQSDTQIAKVGLTAPSETN
jgi:hypothetical protein